jgi:hypothetical protein
MSNVREQKIERLNRLVADLRKNYPRSYKEFLDMSSPFLEFITGKKIPSKTTIVYWRTWVSLNEPQAFALANQIVILLTDVTVSDTSLADVTVQVVSLPRNVEGAGQFLLEQIVFGLRGK